MAKERPLSEKLAAIKAYMEDHRRVAEIARQYGINRNTLYKAATTVYKFTHPNQRFGR